MNTIRTVIVEDEKRSADVFKALLEEYCPEIEVLSVESSVVNAIEGIKRLKPSLVFLDIELPDGNGFNILEAFPVNAFEVIFVTAFEHYAIKAIKASALDYLLKPVDADDLIAAVKKIPPVSDTSDSDSNRRRENLLFNNRQKTAAKQRLALPTMEGLKFIEQSEIIWCEAQGSYTNFLLLNKEKILVSKPLSYFEEILDEELFCRTHQSYVVNLNQAKSYIKGRGGYLIMNDGSKVEVSARMKHNLLERFAK